MPLQTFNPVPKPSPGTIDRPEIKMLVADFGDGYSQEVGDGINPIRRVLTLTWETLLPTRAKSFTDFWRAQIMAGEPFYYTPSDETVALKWTCKEWSDKRGEGGLRTVTATFKQSFNLIT